MQAGKLRYIGIFYYIDAVQSESGAVSRKRRKELFRRRIEKVSYFSRIYKEDVRADEEFFGSNAAFRVRKCPDIEKAEYLRFHGTLYKIVQQEPEETIGSIKLLCKKEDE